MVISFFVWPGKFLMHRFSNPGGESTRSDIKIVVPPQMVHPGVEKNLNFLFLVFLNVCVFFGGMEHNKTSQNESFWDCTKCTFRNNGQALSCTVCCTRKPRSSPNFDPKKQGKGHAVQPKGRKRKQKVKRTQKCKKKRQRTSTKRKKKVIYILIINCVCVCLRVFILYLMCVSWIFVDHEMSPNAHQIL